MKTQSKVTNSRHKLLFTEWPGATAILARFRRFTVLAIGVGLLLNGVPRAQSAVFILATEFSGGVVLRYSGSLNLDGLSFQGGGYSYNPAGVNPGSPSVEFLDAEISVFVEWGGTFSAPALGAGLFSPADTVSGDLFAVANNTIQVPSGYAGGRLSGTMTFPGETLVTLGMTPGSYTWTLPSDSITLTVVDLPTFTNPNPALGGFFGYAVAGVGNDKVLIGAPYRPGSVFTTYDAAFLFDTNGNYLTNVIHESGNGFASALAPVGSNRIVIGAPLEGGVGAAYLYDVNGAPLTDFANPTLEGDFGWSVAAVGTDKVLIGAPRSLGNPFGDPFADWGGVAHLFSTNGLLLHTFYNPNRFDPDSEFGFSVAGVSARTLLVGDPIAGAAYLFSTNGALLDSFSDPSPGSPGDFGWSTAVLGEDMILIGAPSEDVGANEAGMAYLFDTNGVLLTTFTNPTPAVLDHFGISVSAVGTNQVLIGASGDDTAAQRAGAAYLFDLDGTLLMTFTSPNPASDDYFGWSVAGVGTGNVVIGAFGDDSMGINGGAAYLFDIASDVVPPCTGSIQLEALGNSQVRVSWPLPESGCVLYHAFHLGGGWAPLPPPFQTNATDLSVIRSEPMEFFQLR